MLATKTLLLKFNKTKIQSQSAQTSDSVDFSFQLFPVTHQLWLTTEKNTTTIVLLLAEILIALLRLLLNQQQQSRYKTAAVLMRPSTVTP
jgi:hypothetical protein